MTMVGATRIQRRVVANTTDDIWKIAQIVEYCNLRWTVTAINWEFSPRPLLHFFRRCEQDSIIVITYLSLCDSPQKYFFTVFKPNTIFWEDRLELWRVSQRIFSALSCIQLKWVVRNRKRNKHKSVAQTHVLEYTDKSRAQWFIYWHNLAFADNRYSHIHTIHMIDIWMCFAEPMCSSKMYLYTMYDLILFVWLLFCLSKFVSITQHNFRFVFGLQHMSRDSGVLVWRDAFQFICPIPMCAFAFVLCGLCGGRVSHFEITFELQYK